MRTTVSISDNLLDAAKRRAKAHGATLGQVIDSALQRELNDDVSPSTGPEIPVFRAGTGPRAGIDVRSNRAMLEALDQGLELDDRR